VRAAAPGRTGLAPAADRVAAPAGVSWPRDSIAAGPHREDDALTPPLDRTAAPAAVAVIVPTLREAANIPTLIERVAAVRDSTGLSLELVLVDDDSGDGTAELVAALGLPWVRLLVHPGPADPGQAVFHGLSQTGGARVVVLHGDLAHPPERIPALLAELAAGAELAIASPAATGGSADPRGPVRWLERRVLGLLARPLTSARDPLSGAFAVSRAALARGHPLAPVGPLLLLEVLVRCRPSPVAEVPIHLGSRRAGPSKRSLRQALRVVQHLRRLYVHAFDTWSHLVQFGAVGASGVAVNLALLTLFLRVGLPQQVGVGLAILLSMLWNFALNRRFTFSYARRGGPAQVARQLLGFTLACSVGMVVNYAVTLVTWGWFEVKQLAQLLGVVAGLGFNFVGSRFLVFRRPRSSPRDTSSA